VWKKLALSKSYLSNLGKSLYYSAKNVVKNEMPVLSGTYEKNKEIFSSGVQYVKRFASTKGSASASGVNNMVSQFLKDLDDIKRNAFEDLKTGKINNFEREYEAFERRLDLDDDSGDLDDVEFSIREDDTSITIEQTKIREAGSNLRTKALMETIVEASDRSANYIVGNNRKLSSMFMTLSSQMHTETIKTITDTNNLLTSIVEFHNNQIVDHMNKTLTFYDNVLQELREIKEGLIPKKEEPGSTPTSFEDILSSGGLDLKAYGEAIKKNFSTWFGGTSLGLAASMSKMAGGGEGGILGMIKNNPLGFLTDFMVAGLMPKSLKLVMKSLDNSVTGLFSSLILGLNRMKGDFSSPFKQMLGSIFGLEIDGRRKIDPSKFHKGVMQYNGRADKAITEVIPTLLSHILSAVQGSNKVMIYNYSSGKFVETVGLTKDHQKRIRQGGVYEMYDIREGMKSRLAQIKGGTSEFMIEELDTFLDYLITSGRNYNPYTTKSAKDLSGLQLKDERSYNLLRAAFMSMPKSVQNRIAQGIIKGRMGASRTVENIEKELAESGLGIAYSGLEAPTVKAGSGYSTTNTLLRDIKNILIEGIKVVQIGTMPSRPSLLKRIMGRKIDSTNYGEGKVSVAMQPSTPITGGEGPSTLQGKKDLEESFQQSEEQLLRSMAISGSVGYQHTGFRRFVEEVTKQSSLRDKFRVIKQGFSPSNIFTKVANKIDEFAHALIFGRHGKESSEDGDDGGGDGPSRNSFFARMTERISNAIDKSLKWVDKNILSPLHEKFFGEDGIFTKFQQQLTPFLDRFKDFAKAKYEKMKEFFLGSLNKEGFYTGGILADIANSFKDYSNQLRHFFTGSGYVKSTGEVVKQNKETSVFAYVKKYSKNIMESVKTGLFGTKYEIDEVDPETGEVRKVTKRRDDGLLSGIMDQLKRTYKIFDNLFKSKKNESDEDVERSIDQWKRELKGFLPKGLAGGALGAISSAVLPGGPMMWAMIGSTIAFAGHSKKFREFLFGNDEEGRPGIIPPHYKKILNEVKQTLPSILGGGILGLGASLLLPGGPLLGLTLGSAIGFASQSKTMQEWLFGKTDEKGNIITKGVLGPDFKDKMKEYLPSMGAGGILGMGASFFLPGGPLIGLTIGSALGFAAKSKKVQDMLFGQTDKDGNIITKGLITPEMRNKIKENLPRGIAGGIFGALSGLVTGGLLPGGPLVGAMVGASMSILSTSEKFKEFMFGKVDPESGRRVGGLLGSVRDFVRDEFLIPFKGWLRNKGKVIGEWFDSAIKAPLFHAMQPLRAAFGILGKNIKDAWADMKKSFVNAFHEVFTKNVGIPLKNFIKENITDPLKKTLDRFFNFLGKGLSMILTAPIKGLTLFANSIIDSEAEKTGMSRDEILEKYGSSREDKDESLSKQGSSIIEQTKDAISKANVAGLLPAPREESKGSFMDRLNKNIKEGKYGDELKKYGFLQFFAAGSPAASAGNGRLKLDLGGGIGKSKDDGSILSKIFGVLVSFGKKLKNIDESTQSINHQLLDGITVKERLNAQGKSKALELVGSFDYDKFTAHNSTLLQYVRDIRNEVHGQLDGLGYNVETITNIMLDAFGAPSEEAKGLKGERGNRKRRGIFGRIMDIIRSPFTFMKNLTKTLILKPIRRLWNFTTKAFMKIPRMIGRAVTWFGKSLYRIVKLPFRAMGGIVKGIANFFRSNFFKSLVNFSKVLLDGVVVKPLKALFKVTGDVAKGMWQIAKGIGGLAKDAALGMINLTRKAIPAVTKGLWNLAKGIGNLTVKVGKAVMGMAKFAAGLIGRGVRAVGRLFGIGRMSQIQGSLTGLSGKPVYVVGGTLDKVEDVGKVDILNKIEECIKTLPCGGGDETNTITAKRRLGLDLQTFASSKTAQATGDGRTTGTSQGRPGDASATQTGTRKASNIFSRAGSFIARMSRSKWISPIPRIMAIESLTKRVRTEQDYRNASLGLLNELVVSNIQLLDVTNKATTDEKGKSIFDTLRNISSAIKNMWPLLGAFLAPFLRDIYNIMKRLTTGLGRWFGGGPSVDTPSSGKRGGGGATTKGGGSVRPPAGGGTILLPPGGGTQGRGRGGRGGTLSLPGPTDGRGPGRGQSIEMVRGRDGTYRAKPTLGSRLANLARGAKRVPVIGSLLGLGLVGYDAYNVYSAETEEEKDEAKKGLFGTLGGIAGGFAAGAALGAAGGTIVPGIGNIVGATIGGIGGAIIGEAGVRRLYEKKDEIAEWAKDKYNKAKNFTIEAATKFWNSAPVETVRNLSTGFITMISEITSGVIDGGAEILKSLGALVGRLWNNFKRTLNEKWNEWVVEPFQRGMEWIKESWGKFKDWTAEKWNSWVVDPLNNFGNFVSEKWTNVKNWFGEVWEEYVPEPIKNFFGTLKTKFTEIGNWVGDKWQSWIVNPLNRAVGAVREGFKAVGDWVGNKWDDWVVEPLQNFGTGIKNLWNKATDWASDIWNSIFGDRGKTAKEKMSKAGKETGESARNVGRKVARWLDSIAVPDEKGGGDPVYDDLSYAIRGAIPGTDATASDLIMINSIAERFGINPHLWLALAETESNLYSKAVNPVSSARGWGQLLEDTARGIYENTLKLGKYNHNMAFDKNINATMSMAYLRQMFDMFGGDATKAIIAYNVGPGNVKKGIGLYDTGGYGRGHGREYLERVVRNLKENTGLDLKDVVDTSKMTPIDLAAAASITGLAGMDAATSGSVKEYTMASTLGALGTFLAGDKVKEMFGFDPSELTSVLDAELMKQTDPFYAAIVDTSSTGVGATFNAANKTYSSSDINAVKARNSQLYPLVRGDNDVHEFLAERLNNISRAYGKSITINSGYRSDEEQIKLINEWRAKNPGKSEAERRKWVADPGRSNHAVGIAADISGWIQNLSEAELAKFGLYRPMSWEPWHFEPIETKLYGRSRSELMPLFGTPMEPNPNLARYISSEFKGTIGGVTYTSGFTPPIMGQTGGGDPIYDNNFGPPDISEYTQRVSEAVTSSSGNANNNFDKIIQLLTVIASSLENLVGISDEAKEILKNYFESIEQAYNQRGTTSTSRPIVSNTNTPPINPLSSGSGANRKRNDKSGIIAQIAKGTVL